MKLLQSTERNQQCREKKGNRGWVLDPGAGVMLLALVALVPIELAARIVHDEPSAITPVATTANGMSLAASQPPAPDEGDRPRKIRQRTTPIIGDDIRAVGSAYAARDSAGPLARGSR